MASLISYAQNFEDVMLWRALKHVENGFYIDLGAQDPVIDSVSLAFHEHGWTGIHVEPVPRYAQLLREQRPGDTVIEAAVGNAREMLTFFEIPGTGISTADPQIAGQHRERGFEIHEISVPCVRLSSVLQSCGTREIHWMKVDVEGFEQSVLASWGKASARPWIVVVESTVPLTQIDMHRQWEPLLLRRGYAPVYFDGLNRYYIARDHAELKAAFSAPPNVFDDFSINGTASTKLHHHLKSRHEAELAQAKESILRAASEVESLKQELVRHEAERNTQMGDLVSQLAARKEELLRLEQARAQREEKTGIQISLVRQQKEELLSRLAEVERATATQILDWRRQADEEGRKLREQSAKREAELEQRLLALQSDSSRAAAALQDAARLAQADALRHAEETTVARLQLAERERRFGEELLALRRDSEKKLEALGQKAADEYRALASAHAESTRQQEARLSAREQETEQKIRSMEREYLQRLEDLRVTAANEKAQLAREFGDQLKVLQADRQAREQEVAREIRSLHEGFAVHQAAIHRDNQSKLADLTNLHGNQVSQLLRGMEDLRGKLSAKALALENDSASKLAMFRRAAEAEITELRRIHREEIAKLNQDLLDREQSFATRLLAVGSAAEAARERSEAEARKVVDSMMQVQVAEAARFRSEFKERETALMTHGNALRDALEKSHLDLQAANEKCLRMLADSHEAAQRTEESGRMRERALLAELDALKDRRRTLLQALQRAHEEAAAMRASVSWRITAPLRTIGRFVFATNNEPTDPGLGLLSQAWVGMGGMNNLEGHTQPSHMRNSQVGDRKSVDATGEAHGSSVAVRPELLQSDDEEFLARAFQLVLGREIDPEGSRHFTSLLREGKSRMSILAQLRSSPEGVERFARVPNLDEELSRATHARAVATTCEELLCLQGYAFVEAAYLTVLGRGADAGGARNLAEQLARGAAKVAALMQLHNSPEGAARDANVKFTLDAIARYRQERKEPNPHAGTPSPSQQTNRLTDTPTLHELLHCDQEEFLRLAFILLLGRRPDPRAFGIYLEHLNAGKPRLQLLADIESSPEGRKRAALLDQLHAEFRRYERVNMRVVGPLVRFFYPGAERDDADSRRTRALAFSTATALEEFDRRIHRTNQELLAVRNRLHELHVVRSADYRLDACKGAPAAKSEGYFLLTPRSRAVFDQLAARSGVRTEGAH